MRRVPSLVLAILSAGLAFGQAACRSGSHSWVPPEEHKITLVSDPLFVRTSEGDYVDGYLAEYESEFRKERMFVVLALQRYVKGDRLIMSGRPSEATVRIELEGRTFDRVPVYEAEHASPNVPSLPNIPTLK